MCLGMLLMNLPFTILLFVNAIGLAQGCLTGVVVEPPPSTVLPTVLPSTTPLIVEPPVTHVIELPDPTYPVPTVVVDNVRKDEINQLCEELAVDFGNGKIGSYDMDLWQFHTKPLNNKDTGVPGPDKLKSKFLGVTLKPNEYSALTSASLTGIVRTDQQTFINIRYYEATDGITLKACVNGIDDCTPISNKGIALKDLYWRTGTFLLPQTAQKVSLLAVNEGISVGAVGLDNIGIGDDTISFC